MTRQSNNIKASCKTQKNRHSCGSRSPDVVPTRACPVLDTGSGTSSNSLDVACPANHAEQGLARASQVKTPASAGMTKRAIMVLLQEARMIHISRGQLCSSFNKTQPRKSGEMTGLGGYAT